MSQSPDYYSGAEVSDCPVQVYQVAEQRKTDITELWGDNDISVIFWARSMGCFFCQYVSATHHGPLQCLSRPLLSRTLSRDNVVSMYIPRTFTDMQGAGKGAEE